MGIIDYKCSEIQYYLKKNLEMYFKFWLAVLHSLYIVELALLDSYLQHHLYPPPCRLSMRYFRLWINSAFLKPLSVTFSHLCTSACHVSSTGPVLFDHISLAVRGHMAVWFPIGMVVLPNKLHGYAGFPFLKFLPSGQLFSLLQLNNCCV